MASQAVPQALLLQPIPRFLILELTTRCNLRCLYCALAQPDFHGSDLAFEDSGIVEQIVAQGIHDVQISGHGESTIVRDWTTVARTLRAAGVTINLTTNLSKRLEDEEVATLAGMKCITISCDTCDPELFARLRRPARLHVVEENLARLMACFPPRGAGRPYLAINCTLTAPVVAGLPELVRWVARRELDAISLVNLFEYPAVDPDFPVRHPAEVDPRGTLETIRVSRALAFDLGLDFHVMEGLYTRLEEALAR